MFSYRVGAFGWKLAARLGFSLQVQVQILFDQEAGVFVAETTDFMPDFGCVVESDTLEGLEKKLFCAFEDAFEEIFKKPVKEHTFDTILRFAR